MYSMIPIDTSSFCRGCLSSDRNLMPLTNQDLFFYLLGDQQSTSEVKFFQLLLCWECTALVRKIQKFRNRIQHAHFVLCQSSHEVNGTTFPTLSTLTVSKKDYFDLTIEKNEIKQDNEEIEIPKALDDAINKIELKQEVFEVTCDIKEEKDDYFGAETDGHDDGNSAEESRKSTKFMRIFKKKAVIHDFKIDFNNIDQYFDKIKPSHSELEEWLEKERYDSNYLAKSFKCEDCVCGFRNKHVLKKHFNKWHTQRSVYNCFECCINLPTKFDLENHMRTNHYAYRCKMCLYICRSGRRERIRHLNCHTVLYTCKTCNYQAKTAADFSRHYKELHVHFICDYCGKICRIKSSLEKHIKRLHSRLYCVKCKREYNSYRYLKEHYRTFHPELTNVVINKELAYCVECDRQFPSVYKYKRHLSTGVKHNPPKKVKIPCPDCGKIFSRKSYLNNHYRLYHSKNSKNHCEICDKYYANPFGLRKHKQKVHEKRKDPKNKICSICGRGFSTNRMLINHTRTHTGERPYKCALCPAAFAQQVALHSHERAIHKHVRKRYDYLQK